MFGLFAGACLLQAVGNELTHRGFDPNGASNNLSIEKNLLDQEIGTLVFRNCSLFGLFADLAAAESLSRRAVEAQERILGPEHPETIASLIDLASLLVNTGRSREAISLQQRTLEAQGRKPGSEHPDFIRALNQHAYGLRKAGLVAEAEPFDRRAATTSVKVLGEIHPLALHRRNNLVLTVILLDKLDEAREILSQNAQTKTPPFENLTPRIPFLQCVVELLAEKDSGDGSQNPEAQPADSGSISNSAIRIPQSAIFMGRLKFHFAREPLLVTGDIQVPWDIAYFIDTLQPKLGTQNTELLRALVDVLNARTAPAPSAASGSPPSDSSSLLTALDAFPAWREAEPRPFE